MRKRRRNKLDILFSKLTRESDDYTCRHTGINRRAEPGRLDCAHIFSCRHVATRWHPQNVVSLTKASHNHFTQEPFEWTAWCVEQFGEPFIDELRLVAHKPVKWSKTLREEIYQHYKGELKRIQGLRAEGVTGRIEIEPHECMHVFGGRDDCSI